MGIPVVTERQIKIMSEIIERIDRVQTLSDNNINLRKDVLNYVEKIKAKETIISDNLKTIDRNDQQLTSLHVELLQLVKDVVCTKVADPDQLPLETGMGREA